jgi:O-antigen/teichoic acid export membrane protein
MGKDNATELAKDSVIYLSGQIISGIITMLSIVIYTRIFPSSDYGIYSLLYSAVTLIVSLLTGWLSTSTLRFGEVYKNELKILFSSVIFSLSLIYIIVVFIVCILWVYTDLGWYLFIVFMMFISTSLYQVATNYLRAVGSSLGYSIVLASVPIIRLVVMCALYFLFNIGLFSIFIGIVTADIIITFSITKYLNIWDKFTVKQFSRDIIGRFFKYGMPLVASSAMLWVLGFSDRYLIGYYRGPSEAGLYSIGYDLVNRTIGIALLGIAASSFPIIIRTWKEGTIRETEELLGNAIYYFLIISFPLLIIFSIFKVEIFTFVVDESYFPGNVSLPWIAIGTIFLGLAHNFTNRIWQLNERTIAILLLTGITALLNFILNIIFIPFYGFNAASITTAISCFFYLIISYYFSRKVLRPYLEWYRITYCFISVFPILFSGYLVRKQHLITNGIILLFICSLLVILYVLCVFILDSELRNLLSKKFVLRIWKIKLTKREDRGN